MDNLPVRLWGISSIVKRETAQSTKESKMIIVTPNVIGNFSERRSNIMAEDLRRLRDLIGASGSVI